MFHVFERIMNGGVYVIAEMSANHGGYSGNRLTDCQRSGQGRC